MERDEAVDPFDETELIEIDMEGLRETFQQARKRRRLSQLDVANLLAVSQATISAFEKGQYSTTRKKTLNGIWKLVQFWERDAGKIVKGDFAKRSIVTIAERRDTGEGAPSQCPSCHQEIPRHDPPFPFCPFCKTTLGSPCKCGNVIRDDTSNFCACCGRVVLSEGEGPHPYPLLGDTKGELLRLAFLRVLLNALDQSGATDTIIAELEKPLQGKSEA